MDFSAANSSISSGGHVGSFNNIQTTSFIFQTLPSPTIHEKRVVDLKRCPLPCRAFTGRKDALDKLFKYFFGDDNSQQFLSFVLYGLGGSGKSQVAYKFVHEIVLSRISMSYFVDATSMETLESGFKDIAAALDIGESKDAVLNSLANLQEDWFLFFNNADDSSIDLSGYFPRSNRGRILITTRNHDSSIRYATGANSRYHVSNMLPDDAVALILLRFSHHDPDLDAKAAILAQTLGYLALAIAQAASSIATLGMTIDEYLALFKTHRFSLFDTIEDDSYHQTVLSTYTISYDRLSDTARDIFLFCSFMHHDGITNAMFKTATVAISSYEPSIPWADDADTRIFTTLKGLLHHFQTEEAWDELKFKEVMRELRSFSLIDYDEDTGFYSIHPLVHSWTQERSAKEGFQPVMQLFLQLSIPKGQLYDIKAATFRQKYLPHVANVLRDFDISTVHVDAAEVFAKVYLDAVQYKEAYPLHLHVYETRKAALGEDAIPTVDAMGQLTYALWYLGRRTEAEQLRTQVLEKRKKLLGEDHRSTLLATFDMAEIYRFQGRWEQAAELHKRVLEKRTELLGENDPETLLSLNALATTYHFQGKFDDAIKLKYDVWEKFKAVLGEDNITTLGSLTTLGAVCAIAGRPNAEELLTLSYDKLKATVGDNHQSTLYARACIGWLYNSLSKPSDAAKVYEDNLQRQKETIGPEHPDSLVTTYNLAWTFMNLARYDEAMTLAQETFEKQKLILGESDRDTLTTRNLCAILLRMQLRFKEAEDAQLNLLEAKMEVSGPDDIDVLRWKGNLATIYTSQEEWSKAEPIHRDLVERYTRTLGKKHVYTISNTEFLGQDLVQLDRYTEAESLLQESHAARIAVGGRDSKEAMYCLYILAAALNGLGQRKEALALQQEILEWRKKQFGERSAMAMHVQSDIAITLTNMSKYKEAKALQEEVINIRKEVLGGPEHLDTLLAMYNLAWILYRDCDYSVAIEWMTKVLEARTRILGEEHSIVMKTIDLLSSVYSFDSQYTRAEELLKRAMEVREKKLGLDHPDTLTATENLADFYAGRSRWSKAKELNVMVMDKRKAILGLVHADTLKSIEWLAKRYAKEDRFSEATVLQEEALGGYKQLVGEDNPWTVKARERLSMYQKGRKRDRFMASVINIAKRLDSL